ncbi:MAG: H4MPT-linked C1 transfer pathway protein [Gemmatimonadetes bacterium]|nr:H4MPT-linked C1 transfer pathway protein [Gemmatimonadota bacterium]
MSAATIVVGWDIGGANLKAVRLDGDEVLGFVTRPFELWRAPDDLAAEIRHAGRELRIGPNARHAITMTAELADCYRTKSEGVRAVLAAHAEAFPDDERRVLEVEGSFVGVEAAIGTPLSVAGANWMASAAWLASESASPDTRASPGSTPLPDRRAGPAILLDVGSTTTDVIPFEAGRVLAAGRTDPERLSLRELVYTGASRTPLCAVMETAPFRGAECPVAAEHFAIAADAHLWLGDLAPAAYACPTPDGGPADRAGAGARLARMVCADAEMLGEAEISAIARRAADRQVDAIASALQRVAARLVERARRASIHPDLPAANGFPAVIAGSGAWLGEAAARRAGLNVELLGERLGILATLLPAYGAARLLQERDHESPLGRGLHVP